MRRGARRTRLTCERQPVRNHGIIPKSYTEPTVTPKGTLMARSKKWLLGIAGFLVLLFAAIYFLDWNLLKPHIERRVSASSGRTFAINGDLEVHLALRPRIIVSGVVMGNAAWAPDPGHIRIAR